MKNTINKYLFLLIVLLYNCKRLEAQLVFKERLSHGYSTEPVKVIQLPGGDLIMKGQAFLSTNPQSCEFFARINSEGSIAWCRQFTDSNNLVKWSTHLYLDDQGLIHSIGTKSTVIDSNGNILSRRDFFLFTMTQLAPAGNGFKILAGGKLYD